MILVLGVALAVATEPSEPTAAPPPAPEPSPGAVAKPERAPLSFGGTEDLRARYYNSPDVLVGFEDRPILDYFEVVNRIDLHAGSGRFTASLRGDAVALFGNRYILDGELVHENDLYREGVWSPFPDALFTLEKANVQYRAPHVTLDVGDSYLSFGRGIALSLVKSTDIDIDTSLRGVRATVQSGPWGFTAITGVTNPQQIPLENENVGIRPDLFHAVSGLRGERFGLGPLNLAAHGAIFQFVREIATPNNPVRAYAHAVDASTFGASVEAIGIAGIDWYAEGDGFVYLAEEFPVRAGYAGYLSATAYPGRATVLVEARRNRNTEPINLFATVNNYEVASGPTLEYDRAITEDSAAAVNSNDIWGGRARVDLQLGTMGSEPVTLLPYLSLAAFRDLEIGGLHFNQTPETIVHPVAGVLYIHKETHLLLNAGARVDLRDPGTDPEDPAVDVAYGADRLQHADASLTFPLAGPVSLEIAPAVTRFQWGVNAQQQENYTDISNALAVKVGPQFALIVYNDFSDNPLVNSEGNLAEHIYGALEAQVKIGSATTVKGFYGAYRAGIRCAGGQCRSLPGFDGARVSLTTTF